MASETCPWEAASYLVFSSNVPNLLFYSHLTAVLGCALVSAFVIFSMSRREPTSILLLGMFLTFSVWAVLDIITWATNDPSVALFWWSLIILVEPLIFILAFYLFFTFTYPKKKRRLIDTVTFLVFLPLVLLVPTHLNLSGINLYDCVATEGPLAQWYTYFLEGISVIAIITTGIFSFFGSADKNRKRRNVLFLIGLLLFLLSFSLGNIIGSFSSDWETAQYGLFGMPIFLGVLTYLIVKFRLFNIKIIGAQALVLTLWLLIGSLLFVVKSETSRIVSIVTLSLTIVFGVFLIRSVKREVKQREQIEELAQSLKKANDRLKELDKMKSEFVSIASHQLRSPLTSIRGYASMILEGSYGKLSTKANEAVERIAESAKFMALSVEDYLNVSRIEAGNMKYEMSDFNLKETASKVVDELRPAILKKGLLVMFKSDCYGSEMVHADIGKTRQVITNLIDNAMKYTPKGSITVIAHDDVKKMKMYVTIQDTGIGMSKETLEGVFEKFVRAKNANNVNTTGTGLGLFVAKKMIENMGGRVWAESQGEGKGSTFHVELPLLPGQPRLMTK